MILWYELFDLIKKTCKLQMNDNTNNKTLHYIELCI